MRVPMSNNVWSRWLRRLVLSGLSLVLLAACSSNEVDPDDLPAELVSFKPTIKVRKLWSKGIGGDNENLRLALRPAEYASTIYAAAHDGNIMALDAVTGKKRWDAETDLPLSSGPATDGKIVVAGSSNGEIIALEADTGAFRWTVTVTSEVLAAAVIVDDKVIVRTVNGKLAALNSMTGAMLWTMQQSMPKLSVRGTSMPVIANNMIICGFDNGRVAAVDISDGDMIWDVLLEAPSGRTAIERLVDVNSSVQIGGGDVYVVSYQGRLGAIALESGQLLWSREMSSYNGLALDIKTIFVSNQRSELVALSRASGRELWRRKDLRNRDISGPAVIGGSVVVGDFEGNLQWYDLGTGDLQARVEAGSDRITSQPLVVNEILYVMTDAGKLYAYSIEPPKQKGG